MYKVTAKIHSTNDLREVTIKCKAGDNLYIAEYEGELYTAILNPFVSLYYVDDIYGKVGGCCA